MTLNEGSHNQLKWTQDHNIPIGTIPYWNGMEKIPLYLNYNGNEEYWDNLEQVHIRQGEFASLDIGYMFFKDPSLNKNNPYIYKDAWIDIGKGKKPLAAFQQLGHDSISCKIIADGETIDAIKSMKKYEDVRDIVYIFDKLEEYNVRLNVPKPLRKVVYSSTGKQVIEVTNLEDYDFDVRQEQMNYRDYKYLIDRDANWHHDYIRAEMLEKKLETYESRINKGFEKYAKILIKAYPDLKIYQALPDNMWEFGPTDLRKNINQIAKKYNATYRSIWQTWYVYQVEQIKNELKYLEEQLF